MNLIRGFARGLCFCGTALLAQAPNDSTWQLILFTGLIGFGAMLGWKD